MDRESHGERLSFPLLTASHCLDPCISSQEFISNHLSKPLGVNLLSDEGNGQTGHRMTSCPCLAFSSICLETHP